MTADALRQFFAMGGYAFYVWSVYGVALLILIFNIVKPLLKKRQLMHQVRLTHETDS